MNLIGMAKQIITQTRIMACMTQIYYVLVLLITCYSLYFMTSREKELQLNENLLIFTKPLNTEQCHGTHGKQAQI